MSGVTNPAAQKAAGTPIVIAKTGSGARLEKISLTLSDYNEAWLQALAFEHPEVLPINDIEPAFGKLCAVAREVPCGHGYIDNLYVTGAGELVLVEAKLWRNPQARREVVGQALDYVSALMSMGYEAFESACTKGQGMGAPRLYDLVAEGADALSEREFVDAVAANLRNGRMVVIALGDGIRSETEALAGLLQSHAGAHFTFALVELASWLNPITGDIIALPSTLARTIMITRGIVRVEQGGAVVTPVLVDQQQTKPTTISEELFYEVLGKTNLAAPPAVRAFVARLERLGVYGEFLASLNLKADLPGEKRATNFGYIKKDGKLWTDTLAWTASAEIALRYNTRLAALISGEVAFDKKGQSFVTTNGTAGPKVTDFLPHHEAEWFDAISEAIDAIRAVNSKADGAS